MIVGHYGCGGVRAVVDNQWVGLVNPWLRHVEDVRSKHRRALEALPPLEQRYDRLCELNVIEQVVNLCRTNVVQGRLEPQSEAHRAWLDPAASGRTDPESGPHRSGYRRPLERRYVGPGALGVTRPYDPGRSIPSVIVSAARPPIGAFQGALAGLTASSSGLPPWLACGPPSRKRPAILDEAILGCISPLGDPPGPQPGSGRPGRRTAPSVACTTVNGSADRRSRQSCWSRRHRCRFCGGGHRRGYGIDEQRAPTCCPRARSGYRLGLTRSSTTCSSMGWRMRMGRDAANSWAAFVEDCASRLGISREEQDAWALRSASRAQQAAADAPFAWEIEPVLVPGLKPANGGSAMTRGPERIDPARIPSLKPAFPGRRYDHRGQCVSVADGAAAVVLMRESQAGSLGIAPFGSHRRPRHPCSGAADYPTAPGKAIIGAAPSQRLDQDKVDLIRNQRGLRRSAPSQLRHLDLSPDRLNVHGGACALGHPIGYDGGTAGASPLLGALRLGGASAASPPDASAVARPPLSRSRCFNSRDPSMADPSPSTSGLLQPLWLPHEREDRRSRGPPRAGALAAHPTGHHFSNHGQCP